jgi:hypothetical protein
MLFDKSQGCRNVTLTLQLQYDVTRNNSAFEQPDNFFHGDLFFDLIRHLKPVAEASVKQYLYFVIDRQRA